MDLKEKVKNLPETSGVYLMKDKDKNIIYIGKSKCLKNRVSQYFTPSYAPSKKITRMITFIDDIEIIKTDTELDALLLECKLIKQIQPMYNTLMKNDKKYAYIKVNINEEYPDIECVFEKTDNNLYFGPYASMHKLEDIASTLNKYFKIRTCKGSNKLSGCINYDLGFCIAPCKLKDKSVYNNSVKNLIDTLNGSDDRILSDLNKKMQEATNSLNFEQAIKYRDNIGFLKTIIHKSEVINYIRENKLILAKVNIDDLNSKMYLLKGIDVLYSKLIENENLKDYSLKNDILRYINKDLDINLCIFKNYIKKEELDISNIIYSYLNYSKDCNYIEIGKLNLDYYINIICK
jgi:excinuclease ABC subunit C